MWWQLLHKAFTLRCPLLLHFFQLVQVTAEALGFAVVLAVEVVQNHGLSAAEFFDFLSQCGDLLGKLAALGDLQQGYSVAVGLQLLLDFLSESCCVTA